MPDKLIYEAPQERERRAAGRFTGRYLITTKADAHEEVSEQLSSMGMAQVGPIVTDHPQPMPPGGQIQLPNIGVVLVDPPTSEHQARMVEMAEASDAVVSMEPERINSTMAGGPEYIAGWRDAIASITGRLLDGEVAEAEGGDVEAMKTQAVTWGLDATGARTSHLTGAGVKLCVLDTGLDLHHPDFAGRNITTKNFVGDHTPFHDGVGHGTHCLGTAAGIRKPKQGPRYGVAHEAQLFVGRVLDDTGRGGDFNILQGIDWAIGQGCQVISMSLGAPWLVGAPPYSQAYEAAAQRALAAGCLLIVAAGNEAARPAPYTGAVGTPGNSPSVLTVAAIDKNLATASFSNRIKAIAPGVKGPDLCGPGVEVYSSWLMPQRYNTIAGTSMATPHVAGIAALYVQAAAANRGQALKNLLIQKCRALPSQATRRGEIGAGLVQAPL